ncbi:MAG: GNAT family N-acetyltransferase [Candidatus Poribacteria bacterium]|nr:GNAT family N-acetyltransferase [Candidatus Poribacteria bacterium]
MEILQYTTPDMVTPLTQFYNRLIAEVPHCYPIQKEEMADAVNGIFSGKDDKNDSETAFVATVGGVVKAFIHVGLCQIGPKANKEDAGLIRFMGYERGARPAGQAVLEKAEEYLKAFDINRICAFRSDNKYRFYHLEYANLSEAFDHVHALLGFNGYHARPRWVFLNWEDYDVTPIPAPIPVKLSVNWRQGRGQRPDCGVIVTQENEQIGECFSFSGGEYSTHHDAQDWCFTTWLEVESEFQGHGLGKFLLQYSLQEMQKIGYRHASVSTSWENFRALLLYSNCGYRVVDRTCEYEKVLSEVPTQE